MKQMRILILFLALALPLLLPAQRRMVISSVNIVDVVEGRILPGRFVTIEGDRIISIRKSFKQNRDVQVVDGRGKYLIPGLTDFDAMITNRVANHEAGLELMLAWGVTTVRDRGPRQEMKFGAEVKRELEDGSRTGPRLLLISHYITSKGKAERKVVVRDASEVASAVDTAVLSGADVIRVDNTLDMDLLKAAVARASFHRKPLVTRVTYPFIDAAAAGVSMIDHASELRRTTTVRRDLFFEFSKRVIDGTGSRDEQYNNVLPALGGTDTAYFLQTIDSLKRHNTWLCIGGASYMPSLLKFEMGDTSRNAFRSERQAQVLKRAKEDLDRTIDDDRYRNRVGLDELKWAHSLGVQMVAGSQMGDVHTPGLSLHDSFYWMQVNGFTPADILRLATINPARFMQRAHETGLVKEGYQADLVLLNANPLEDIGHAQRIEAVIIRGKLFDRKDLDQLIARSRVRGR